MAVSPSADDPVATIASALAALRTQNPDAHARLRRAAFDDAAPPGVHPAAGPPPTFTADARHATTAQHVAAEEHWRVHQWYQPLLFWRARDLGRGPLDAAGPSLDVTKKGRVSALDVFSFAAAIIFVALFIVATVAVVFTTIDFVDANNNKPNVVEQEEIPDDQYTLPVLTICPTYGDIPSYAFTYTFSPGPHAQVDPDNDVESFWSPDAATCADVDTSSPIATFDFADAPLLSNRTFAQTFLDSSATCRWCMRLGYRTNITADKSAPLFPEVYPSVRVSMNKTLFNAGFDIDWYAIFVQSRESVDNLEGVENRPPTLQFDFWKSYGYRFEREVIRVAKTVSDFYPTVFATNIVDIQLREDQTLPDDAGPIEDFVLQYGYESTQQFRIKEGPGYSPWEYVNDIMGFISLFCGLTLFHLVVYPAFHYLSWRKAKRIQEEQRQSAEFDPPEQPKKNINNTSQGSLPL